MILSRPSASHAFIEAHFIVALCFTYSCHFLVITLLNVLPHLRIFWIYPLPLTFITTHTLTYSLYISSCFFHLVYIIICFNCFLWYPGHILNSSLSPTSPASSLDILSLLFYIWDILLFFFFFSVSRLYCAFYYLPRHHTYCFSSLECSPLPLLEPR